MTNFIPIFPLNIVVFPEENLNLHIFEPRYKQMINDCIEQKKMFGIIPVIDKKLQEHGTLVDITELTKKYDDGKMDIKTKAIKVFRVLESVPLLPNKLYGGAIVNYTNYYADGLSTKMQKIVSDVHAFHVKIQVEKEYKKNDKELRIHDIVHHVGLSLKQEYEVLCLPHESQQQEYLLRHLVKIKPEVNELSQTIDRIKMNGHFRDLRLDDFNL